MQNLTDRRGQDASGFQKLYFYFRLLAIQNRL